MRKSKYPKSVTVRMTHEMYATLRRLATDDRKVADLIRQLIRDQLDERAELAGNRRHFTRRFQERIDELEESLELRLSLIAMLVTMFEELVIHAFEITEGQKGKLAYPALFRDGVHHTAEYWQEIEFAIDRLREIMAGIEEGGMMPELVMEGAEVEEEDDEE